MISIISENFDLNQIADSGQCFRMKKLRENLYRIIAFGKYLEIQQDGKVIYFHCSDEDYQNIWKDYFDIDQNYSSYASTKDTYVQNAFNFGQGIRILKQDLFETTISFIISQQKSIPCIQKCVEQIAETFGEKIYTISSEGDIVIASAFPSVETMSNIQINDLKNFGLGYRDAYIYDAIQWFIHDFPNINKDQFYTDYNYAMESLKSIKGVGDKVANCICLFSLHQLNACPIDVHMQRIIDSEYHGIKPEWMSSPFAGVLQQYCFYYKRNLK